MSVREFEALGPMLRAIATRPRRCQGDVLLAGPMRPVVEFYGPGGVVGGAPEGSALVDGELWGVRLTSPDLVAERLVELGAGDVADALSAAALAAPTGGTVTLVWFGAARAAEVHLLVDAPPAPAPGTTEEPSREAFGDAPPAPAPGEGAMRAAVDETVARLRAAGLAAPRRLIGESEQRAAVAWAEGREVRDVSSDRVTAVCDFGGLVAFRRMTAARELPPVGSVARGLYFEAVALELLHDARRGAPKAERVALFVGALLVRVWTATGGSTGGPAVVQLDDNERRADVARAEASES